ncbi:radical SAM protein [Kordiimonas pumila]|uniref:Radical SAM protein n=1 Tax=Kordiimonas pumila TaxID=2161677 RepID=A0ABV7D951_9PROT|nr:radical SAM protein [Kordiimonas pumila]
MKAFDHTQEFARGMQMMTQKQSLPEAERIFKSLLANSADPSIQLQLGITLRVQKKWKEASATFKRVIAATPHFSEAHAHLAETYHAQQKNALALQTFETALKLDPDNAYAHTHMAVTYFDIGELNLAQQGFKTALTCMPADMPAPEATLCKHYLDEIATLFITLETYGIDPSLDRETMGIALYKKANALTLASNLDDAVICYDLAAQCRTDYGSPELNVGETVDSHQSRMPEGAYKSCSWLEGGLHFHENRLTFCCTAHSKNKGWTAIGQFNGGKLPVDYILAKRAQITNQLMCGTDNGCTGCPKLVEKEAEEKEFLFNDLIINSFSVCNFRCSYCSLTHQNFEMPAYYYYITDAIDAMLENNWLGNTGTITWGGGDPSVSKEFKAITAKLVAHGSRHIINTNAAIHVPEIDTGLENKGTHLCISVDAGTRSTFNAVKFNKPKGSNEPILIKGKDAYDAVWDTISKYTAINAMNVLIKYIVDDINASRTEIDTFLDKCVKAGVRRIMYTPEGRFIRQIPITREILPENIFDTIQYATARTQALGMICSFDPQVYVKEVFSEPEVSPA